MENIYKRKQNLKIIAIFVVAIFGSFFISQIFNFSTADNSNSIPKFQDHKIIDPSKDINILSSMNQSSLSIPTPMVPFRGDSSIDYRSVQNGDWNSLDESKKIVFPNPNIIKNMIGKYSNTSPYNLGNVSSKDEKILLSTLRRLITTTFLASYDCTDSDCKWWKFESGTHRGVDIVTPTGTPVVAAADGIIFDAKNGNGFGNNVVQFVQINGQYYALVYAHLNQYFVQKGMIVKKGEQIGEVGKTGNVTTSHLHFQAYKLGSDVTSIVTNYYNDLKIESKGDSASDDELLTTLIDPLDLMSGSTPVATNYISSSSYSSVHSVAPVVYNTSSSSTNTISQKNKPVVGALVAVSNSSSSQNIQNNSTKFTLQNVSLYNSNPKKGGVVSLNIFTTGKDGVISLNANNNNVVISNDRLVYDGDDKYSVPVSLIEKGNTRISISDGTTTKTIDLSIQDEQQDIGLDVTIPSGFITGIPFDYSINLIDDLSQIQDKTGSAKLTIRSTNGVQTVENSNDINFSHGKFSGKLTLPQDGNYTITFNLKMDGVNIISSKNISTQKFSDLSMNDPRYKDIKKMIDQGIINGSNGKLNLTNNITRGEFATILARSVNSNGSYNTTFDDISGHWAQNSIQKVASAGLFKGTQKNGKNYFYPDQNISVAEVVTVLARANSLNIGNGKNWYDGAIALASKNNLYPNISSANPVGNATRGDAVASLSKYLDFGGIKTLAIK